MIDDKQNKHTMISLNSVGTILDTENETTYPMLANGSPDLASPFHIEDIENLEWFENLSDEDREVMTSHFPELMERKEQEVQDYRNEYGN